MVDIFVGYASEDRARVEPLVGALEARGWSVCWDMKHVRGTEIRDGLVPPLEVARCVVVAWSPRSVDSEMVQEWAAQAKARRVLVP